MSNSLKPILLRFKFDDFENLPSSFADSTSKSARDCHGKEWVLILFPGGGVEERTTIDMHFFSPSYVIGAKKTVILRDAAGGVFYQVEDYDVGTVVAGYYLWSMDLTRLDILDNKSGILRDGALVFDVELQILERKSNYQPSNPAMTNMLTLLSNGKDSDAAFKVGDVIFPVHKLILKMNAPLLHGFCKDTTSSSPVVIENTSALAFKYVLRYIYGGNPPDLIGPGSMDAAWSIIETADRFSLVDLKMALENILVEQRILNVDNVIDWLLFSDSKTCPFLKEYATSFFVGRAKDVLAHESFGKLKESPKLMSELMLALSNESKHAVDATEDISVDELRKKLNENGIDVDGTKDVLTTRMEQLRKRQRTE